MKVTRILAAASLSGVIVASLATTPVLAWEPKGAIKKSVQNQTTGSTLSDANDAASAVAAKPGDILKYVIEVSNTGNSGNKNEMHFTELTDTLPTGVQLVGNANERTITEDLGILKPGEKKTKEYLVKLTATKDGEVIENKACFTGDSEAKDKPQHGCDTANIKVSVPKEEPKPEPKPEQPKPEPQTPAPQVQTAELPHTGATEWFAPLAAAASGAAAYTGRLLTVKRQK